MLFSTATLTLSSTPISNTPSAISSSRKSHRCSVAKIPLCLVVFFVTIVLMILLDRVTKTYNKNLGPALDRVSLHVEPKEFVIVVGQSGAGKSTLLKLLTREERQTSGKIVIGGIDYDKLRDKDIPLLRRKIGVVFQDFKLLPNKTVFENVAFALEIVGISNREIRHTVPKVLDIVNLKGKENRMPRELSGGERQRVAIARAIVRQPRILIA